VCKRSGQGGESRSKRSKNMKREQKKGVSRFRSKVRDSHANKFFFFFLKIHEQISIHVHVLGALSSFSFQEYITFLKTVPF